MVAMERCYAMKGGSRRSAGGITVGWRTTKKRLENLDSSSTNDNFSFFKPAVLCVFPRCGWKRRSGNTWGVSARRNFFEKNACHAIHDLLKTVLKCSQRS